MSENNDYVHQEKRQIVTGNSDTDIPTVNVSINVERPINEPAGTIVPEVKLNEITRKESDNTHNTYLVDTTITKTTLSNEELKKTDVTPNTYEQNKAKLEDVKEKGKEKLEDVKDTTNEAYYQGKEKLQDLSEKGKEKLEDVKDATKETYYQGKEKLQDLTEKGKDTLVDVKDKTMETYDQGKEKLQDLTEKGKETLVDVKDKTMESYDQGKEKLQDLTEKGKEKLADVKVKTMESYDQGKEKLQDLTEKGKETLVDAKVKTMESYDQGKEKLQDLTEKGKEKLVDLKVKTMETYDQGKEKLVDVKDKAMESYNQGKEKLQDLTDKGKETLVDVKDKTMESYNQGKEKLVDVKDKIMENYNQGKEKLQDLTEKGKEAFTDLKEKTIDTYNQGMVKLEEKVNMFHLLKSARYCLEDFMHPTLAMEKQIPIRILSNAFGLIFLTEYKGSFGIGSSIGTGLIIARKANNEGWTGPCAIGMGGLSFGLQAGVQKTDHIIVLRDQNVVNTFINKGQFKLGGDISFAVGPLGRDAQIVVDVNDKDYTPTYSYSMSKGLHLGVSLEGQLIFIREDCNEDYYGKKVSAKDILFGNVDALSTDNVYSSLIRLVEEYTQKQGQLSQDLFTSKEIRQDDKFWEKEAPIDTQLQPLLDTDANIGSENLSKHEEKSNLFFDSNKEHLRDVKKERISMDRLLRHARFNFEHFMNPNLAIEKQIPATVLNNACGLLFLTEIKGGIGIGGSTGIGFIIAHNVNENTYSQPCVVGMGGISLGFQIGGQKTEHILIFRDEQVLKTFINKGELNFGGDMSFAVGPLGRDVDVPINPVDKGYAAIYSYSTSNGAYVGLTMERQMLKVLDDWNEDYFGKKVTANDILFGGVKPLSMDQHNVYDSLINLIKEYIRNKGILVTNNTYWGEIERQDEQYWKLDGVSFAQNPLDTSVEKKL